MRSAERGFTLIETIVAIGVLAGAVVSLAQLVAVCTGTNAAGQHRTRSAWLAQQKIEQLRSEPVLDATPRTVEYLDPDGTVACPGELPCPRAVYVREWSVQPSATAAAAVFVHVSTRRARDGGGDVHLVTVRPRALR
jgi:prepilin-type N-terminal cleavage/methylation domain-containing protein